MIDKKCDESGMKEPESIMINSFETGFSVGDPLLNCNAPLSSELRVTTPEALAVYITLKDYKHVFREQIE